MAKAEKKTTASRGRRKTEAPQVRRAALPEPLDPRSREWLRFENAFGRFLEAAWGNTDRAVYNLQQILEDERDLLRSFELRLPVRHQRPDGSAIWIPAHEEKRLLSHRSWRSEVRCALLSAGRVRVDERKPQPLFSHRLYFVRRADLDAILPPPSQPEATAHVLAFVWASRIAKQMKDDGKIPEGVTQDSFAEMIVQRMHKEAADDPSLGKPPSKEYVRGRLKEWALRPPNLT